ncbi:MAG TPA: hypothetical protein VLZ03_14005 [Thermodesulfobacteriota bacterium]|nr:hypothetical protein [Thermodesulfobacteriota bacterium]
MKDKISRRKFLGKAALATLTVPAVLGMGTKKDRAMAQATTGVKGSGAKMKKICLEEHWSNREV